MIFKKFSKIAHKLLVYIFLARPANRVRKNPTRFPWHCIVIIWASKNVDVFSTVFMMRWINGSCSNDHLSWTRLSKSNARKCRNASWLAHSTIPFSSLEYAVVNKCSILGLAHYEKQVLGRYEWLQGPIWLSMTNAVSKAVTREQFTNVIQMKNFKWIIRRISESMSSHR